MNNKYSDTIANKMNTILTSKNSNSEFVNKKLEN